MLNKYNKAILDNSPESIVLIDGNHHVLAYNKTIKEILFQYFNREIQLGDHYYPDFVIESNQELYLQAFDSAINGKPFSVQTLTKNDQVSYWFEYKMNPIYDEDGILLGVSLSAKNITAEKEAELKIVELSEKLKAILDNTDESITLLDLDCKIMAINSISAETAQRNTNLDNFIGRDFRELIPDKNNLFYKYYPKAASGISSTVEVPYQNIDGDWLWYQTKFNPVYDKDEQLIGVSIFANDITARKNIELSLKESEDRFRSITTLAPVGIIITNNLFEITYVNVAAKKMLEYNEESELNALKITDIIHSFKLTGEHKIRVDDLSMDIETPIFNQEQFIALTKTKQKIDILLSSNSFFTQSIQSYMFIIQDITNEKQKEDLIAIQNNKLRDIAWYQSHIIRAPLARIMGLVALLENKNFDVDTDERDIFYNAILDSSNELDKVIHDIVKRTE
jgi:PAS domain S-box-containing protein